MKIVIIRHAEPDYENNTLTEKGFIEAKALGEMYSAKDFDYVFTSPLPRARLTCDAIIKGEKEIVECEWLKEFKNHVNYKEREGITWDFIPSYFEELKDIYDYDKYLDTEVMRSGNVKEDIFLIYNELNNILKEHGYQKEGRNFKVIKANKDTILFVCHFGMMSILMSYFMNIPFSVIANHTCCVPSGVTVFVTEEREEGIAQFRMLKFGDTSHLSIKNLKDSFSGRFCETFDSPERH